uniref:Transposase n=1 Tax=Bradyrhizobium barranii subsp. barranii TaxID=2823807 RepID=A0A939MHY2_9BRAD
MAEALEPGVSGIAHRIGIHPSQLFAWRSDARAERLPVAALEWRSRRDVHISDRNFRRRGARRRRCRRGTLAAGDPGGPIGMIPSGVKVFLTCIRSTSAVMRSPRLCGRPFNPRPASLSTCCPLSHSA